MAFKCYQNVQVVLLVMLAIQMYSQRVLACGGHFATHNSIHVIYPGWPRYTYCNYDRKSIGQTPTDIREDTEFLFLHNNKLIDANLSTASIREQVTTLLGMDLSSNYLTQVPDLKSFKSSMTYISLSRNRLKGVVNLDYFSDFPLMRTLIFTSNQITTINLTKPITPQYLYFDSNRLTSIDMNTFSVITEITYLTFRSNPLTEFIYPSTNGSVKLSHLSLSYTQVINEHKKVENLSSITHLELEYAGMSTFNYSMFVDLKELWEINLNRNYNIEMAPVASGTSLDKLNKLKLAMCNIPGTFNLTQVSTPILPALTHLEIHQNQLESVFIEDGYNLSAVVYLQLERNLITEFNFDFYIAVFPQVQTLNLRYNGITQITFPGNGTYHPSLKTLYLEYNPIVSVSDYCLPYFSSPNYFRLYLRSTQLRCDACILWLVSCPHDLHRDNPNCVSPNGLSGMTLTEATPFLIDIPCSLNSDDSSIFKMKSPSAHVNPTVSIETRRGIQECAVRTKLSKSTSFKYNETSHICDIYKKTGGSFELV